jgi:hypothetical protein
MNMRWSEMGTLWLNDDNDRRVLSFLLPEEALSIRRKSRDWLLEL